MPAATDDKLVTRLHDAFSSHQDYIRPRGNECQFTLRHYAGSVTYSARGFLYKNRDTLAVDVIGALRVRLVFQRSIYIFVVIACFLTTANLLKMKDTYLLSTSWHQNGLKFALHCTI